MSKPIIIMTPNVYRAVYEYKAFLLRWATIIKKTNKANLCIELLNGRKIYFKTETQEKRGELLGLYANVTSVDKFVMPEAEGEDKHETDRKG